MSMRRNGHIEDSQEATQSRSKSSVISPYEFKRLLNSCLRYILNVSGSCLTIKRQDIIKVVFDGQLGSTNQVMKYVKDMLLEIYGYEVTEIREDNSNLPLRYILIRDDEQCYDRLELRDELKFNVILRYLIITHLHMSGGSSSAESLSMFLQLLDITLDDNTDPYFGDVKKRLIEFSKQRYISMETGADKSVTYSLGRRAYLEYNMEDLERNYFKQIENMSNLQENYDSSAEE